VSVDFGRDGPIGSKSPTRASMDADSVHTKHSCAMTALSRANRNMDYTPGFESEDRMRPCPKGPLDFSFGSERSGSAAHTSSAPAPNLAATSSTITSSPPNSAVRKSRVALACQRCKRRKQRVSQDCLKVGRNTCLLTILVVV
jgi:hypothetical protein